MVSRPPIAPQGINGPATPRVVALVPAGSNPAPVTTDRVVESLADQLTQIAHQLHALPAKRAGADVSRRRSTAEFARLLIRERRARSACIPADLLGEPVWDLLLDLYAAAQEGRPVSVTSACIASGIPSTTALRYIRALEQREIIRRVETQADRRVNYLTIAPQAALKMTELLEGMLEARAPRRTVG